MIASAGGSGTAFTTASVAVSASVTLPGGSGPGWTLYVAPAGGGGWGPAWRGGYTAAVVLVAVGLGLMVFLLLVARCARDADSTCEERVGFPHAADLLVMERMCWCEFLI